jgi:hypothetical protein
MLPSIPICMQVFLLLLRCFGGKAHSSRVVLSGKKEVRYIHPAPAVYIHARNYVNRNMKYKVCLIGNEMRGFEI